MGSRRAFDPTLMMDRTCESDFPSLARRLQDFLRKQFQAEYDQERVTRLIGDASFRQYFRYVSESNQSFILAVYPEPFDKEHFTYRQVYDLLRELDLPVPQIVAMDGELGIVLQEDLGDELLRHRLFTATVGQRKTLLTRAIDHLVTIQRKGTAVLKPEHEASRLAFDEKKLTEELNFFRRHYLGGHHKQQWKEDKLSERQLEQEFSCLAVELAAYPHVLCHRDYHVRNLIVKKEELYIIDFQDARMGPPSYDFVSLLKDSIDLGSKEIDEYTDYFLAQAQLSSGVPEFQRQFHLMCIQRLLKALGTYGHQIAVRHNLFYEEYIRGSLHRALLSLQAIPEFPYIRSIIETELKA